MPPEEKQNPEEPVCQSVLLFACKGMIEGIIVLLFVWLLVQVLFTKHLEVHLQILMSVGLVVLCFTLILGCFVCWCKTRHREPEDKKDVTSPPQPDSVDHMVVASSPSHSSGTTFTKLQYEELDGDVLDYPSAFESSTTSDEEWSSAVSEVKQKVCFQMRRLSSPTISTSLYRPMASSRSSLPLFPRLSLLAKTRKTLERQCTVAGDGNLFSEHKGHTIPSSGSSYTRSSLQTQDLLGEEPLLPYYGSNSEISNSFLHFTLTFSSLNNSLSVSLVGITGKVHSLDEVNVQVRLLPLCPEPLDTSAQDQSLGDLVVSVGSLERLKSCILELSVFSQDHLKTSLLGELEVCCGALDWTPDRPVSCVRELRHVVDNTEMVTS